MSNEQQEPFRESHLDSPEYRERLMRKLNCLIAVLEVAIGKISKSMGLPGANEERLLKIRTNLENTLAICHRAKQTLEKTSGAKSTSNVKAPAAVRRATAIVPGSAAPETAY